MNISVELTLSPLQDDFETPIIQFIKKLRTSGLTVLENPLSTQVFGDYDNVMTAIQQEMKNSFLLQQKVVFNMKVVNTHLQEKPSI